MLLDTHVSLLLDFGVTLEEDFALLLDSLLLLDPFDSADAPLRVTLLDEEEDSSSTLLDESSGTGSTKLLLSSSQAVKQMPKVTTIAAIDLTNKLLIEPPAVVIPKFQSEI